MPKPKWGRKDVFEDVDASTPDPLPQRDVTPNAVPYIPTSVLNRVYETGANGFPDVDFVSPEEKRIEELEGQLAEIQQQLQGRTNAMSVQDGTLIVHDFQLTSTGLVAPEQVSFESWEQIGQLLFRLEGSIQWLIGDWLVYGMDLQYGDIDQIAAALGREAKTLYNYCYYSRAIESSLRREDLSYNHHALVVKLDPQDQAKTLAYAAENGLSIAKFRQWLFEQYGVGNPTRTPALSAELRFRTIADELDKFALRDPAAAKPNERAALMGYAAQMRTWLDALEKKWNAE